MDNKKEKAISILKYYLTNDITFETNLSYTGNKMKKTKVKHYDNMDDKIFYKDDKNRPMVMTIDERTADQVIAHYNIRVFKKAFEKYLEYYSPKHGGYFLDTSNKEEQGYKVEEAEAIVDICKTILDGYDKAIDTPNYDNMVMSFIDYIGENIETRPTKSLEGAYLGEEIICVSDFPDLDEWIKIGKKTKMLLNELSEAEEIYSR